MPTLKELHQIAVERARHKYPGAAPIVNDFLDILSALGTGPQWRAMVEEYPAQRRALYFAYLRSVAWQRKRAACLEAAGGLCARCMFGIATQAHHKTYAQLGDERPEDLEALCRECHASYHQEELP